MGHSYRCWLVVLLVVTAGCTAGAEPDVATAARNATLSAAAYEQTVGASPVETRRVYDRSASWEAAGERNLTVASRAVAYQNATGTDTVVVYTTPAEQYVDPDRLRTLSASGLASVATRSVGDEPRGTAGGTYNATLLGERTRVRTLVDNGTVTAHVARVVRDDVIVVVVVSGGADRATVERVLGSVRLDDRAVTADS